VQALKSPHHINDVSCRLLWGSMSSALFRARTCSSCRKSVPSPPFFADCTSFHFYFQRKNLQGETFLWSRDITADPAEDIAEDGISGLEPAAAGNIEEFTLWLHCLAAYFQMGTAQKAKGLEALERAKACVPANSPLLLICSARVAEMQGHKDDALLLYNSAAACHVGSASSHPLLRYHSPELYLGRWCDANMPP
jgi:hypothetical protein